MRYIIAILAFIPSICFSQDAYIGANLVQVYYKETGLNTAKPFALAGRIGKEINPYFAVEGRLGIGFTSDTIDVFGIPVDVEVDQFFGVYARGILPLAPTVSVYGLLGYTDGEITASACCTAGGNIVSISASDSATSFGIGLDVALNSTIGLNAEYAKLFDDTGYDVYGLSAGVRVNF